MEMDRAQGSGSGSRAAKASRLTLPKLEPPPASVLAFLSAHFASVSDWESRMAKGLVSVEGGGALGVDSPYRAGLQILYFREVETEPLVPFEARILSQDAHLLVADKPHFLPVTPGGHYVQNTLLAWLQAETGLPDLAPLHRLDRDTAGLVLFSTSRESRSNYSQLFSSGRITKIYHAVALAGPDSPLREWRVENRLEKGEPFFRMACVEGPVNARSTVRLLTENHGQGLFEIRPDTGKKHQIRLHMAAIGHPILHDPFYPELQPEAPPDFTRPLQLLAKGLEFVDPITDATRVFESQRKLIFDY